MARRHGRRLRRSLSTIGTFVALITIAAPVAAHGGSLGVEARETVTVPTWLFLLTGGAAVGASFLLASFVTDRRLIEGLHGWRRTLPFPSSGLLVAIVRIAGVLGLVAIVAIGYLGPSQGLGNLAVLGVWVGWWAGYTATAYLLGESWRVLNPWRTIAGSLPSLDRDLPAVGAWPSVVGLLALIWVEVVSPLADTPALLATIVLGYSAVTLVGAVVFDSDAWFEHVDPVSRVFHYYGHVAPVASERTATDADRAVLDDGRHPVRLPGVGLTRPDLLGDASEVAFVVALLWATTYDGFVATPAWRDIARPLVEAGVPAHVLYPLVLVVGFVFFLAVYRLASRYARRTAETYLSATVLARRFAPPLLAIAAGYHLAHYLGYFLSLAPVLLTVLGSPLSPPVTVPVLSLPGWFTGVPVASVLLGHLLAIWIAHATAFELFPGRLQAIRSQYPFIAVMVLYTMTSLWIVTQPSIQPPFL
ncbi:hypothetical protein [Halorhabdus amylolytica]|uniref:hypothetical protein n=1 Tax=Halorhabdus amylolytica TaxID=2559573 RepID=UPI0020C12E15|nr:hypothetical protein [Halorhabdus amylolytica]